MSVYRYVSDNWLNLLVVVHVLAAIIGIGPTFFANVLLRRGQTLGQIRNALALSKSLEAFPKVLGSLAVLSGVTLAWLGDYSFSDLWIYGSLIIYVLIQIIVIGFLAPASKRAAEIAAKSKDESDQLASVDLAAALAKANAIHYGAAALGVLLFLFMFFKPVLA